MIRNETILEVEEKIRQLITILDRTREDLGKKDSAVGHLESKIKEMENELDHLRQKYESLKLAKSLSGESTGSSDAKMKINNIVRGLDRCIALLNQ